MMNEVDWWGLETQHSDTVTRDELKTSLAAAIARAEAAEKRVAELEKEATRHHEDYDGLYQDYEEVKAKWEGTADIGAELYTLRQRVAELEAKLAAVGGWEVPDGVEYPVGHVDVLVVREAVWRDGIEEWEDTRSDLYLHGVIAYRDKPRRDSGE